jgi:hypothetical protein
MAIEVLYSVLTPEPTGKITGLGGPPGMGGPPRPGGQPRMAAPPPSSSSVVRRLDNLANKTVYLVDTGYGGSYQFMQALQKWFGEHIPSLKTIRKRKTGNVFMDDTTDLWEEVKTKGHAVVLGVAG